MNAKISDIKSLLPKKFTLDTIWLMIAQFIVLSTGFAINLLIGREYGAEMFGLFSQSLSFYMILAILFSFGLNNTMIKKISEGNKSEAETKKLFTANLTSVLLSSTILTGGVIAIITNYPELLSSKKLAQILAIQLMALPFFSANKNIAAYYTGKREQKLYAVQRIIRWVSLLGLFIAAIVNNTSLEQLIYAFVYVEGAIFLYNLFLNRHNFDFTFSIHDIKQNIRFGLGSYSAEITSVLSTTLDVIIVGYFLSASDAGHYSFIVFFIKTLYVFPGIIMQNISPIVSKHWTMGKIEELNQKLKKVRKINLGVISIQLVSLLLFYQFIIQLMEKEFQTDYLAFGIAALGAFIFSLISWGGSILIMTGRLKANFYRTLSVLLINVTTLIVLTYHFGFYGSILAILLNGVFAFLLLRTFIMKKTGIRLI